MRARRRMYDCIAQQSPTLPPGVQLPEVLEGASEVEIAEVLASIPPKGETIKAHQLIAAGGGLHWTRFQHAGHQQCTHPGCPMWGLAKCEVCVLRCYPGLSNILWLA